MKKLIYISHPSGGKLENQLDVELIIETLYKYDFIYNSCAFVSPIHNYGYMYNTVDYDKGLSFCIDLLQHADEMWVFGDWLKSTGCKIEVDFCRENNIPIRFMGSSDNLDRKIIEEFPDDIFITPITCRAKVSTETLYLCISEEEMNNLKDKCVDLKDIVKNRKLYSSIGIASDKAAKRGKNSHYIMLEITVNTLNMSDVDSDRFYNDFEGYVLNNNLVSSEKEAFNKYVKEYTECKFIYSLKRRVHGAKKLYKRGKVRLGNYNIVVITNPCCIENIKLYNNYTISTDRVIIGGNPIY